MVEIVAGIVTAIGVATGAIVKAIGALLSLLLGGKKK